MALVMNEKGLWAWVDAADEQPKAYYQTKDEAIKNRPAGERRATTDAAADLEGAYTNNAGEWP